MIEGGGWPAQFVTVLGSRIDGDEGLVWVLTNDRPRFEEYVCWVERLEGLWRDMGGYGGFGIDTPVEVRLAAEKIYARFD